MLVECFVEGDVTENNVILFAEIAFPVELVPCQIAAFVSLEIGRIIGIKVAHF